MIVVIDLIRHGYGMNLAIRLIVVDLVNAVARLYTCITGYQGIDRLIQECNNCIFIFCTGKVECDTLSKALEKIQYGHIDLVLAFYERYCISRGHNQFTLTRSCSEAMLVFMEDALVIKVVTNL